MKNVAFWDIKLPFVPQRDILHLRYRAQPVNVMLRLRFSRRWLWRVPSSGMLRRVARVRTDVSEERIAYRNRSILRTNTMLRWLVPANVVTSSPILVTLMMDAIRSSDTSFLTKATQRNVPDDGILQSYSSRKILWPQTRVCQESVATYKAVTVMQSCSHRHFCNLRLFLWHAFTMNYFHCNSE
jgi:hypothetical protein